MKLLRRDRRKAGEVHGRVDDAIRISALGLVEYRYKVFTHHQSVELGFLLLVRSPCFQRVSLLALLVLASFGLWALDLLLGRDMLRS